MVKYFHSNMPGAPVLSGTAGALIAILDACLVNGFGLKSVDNLVIAGGVATMTISSGMTFEADVVVQLAGITGGAAALNGDRRILSIAGNTATFAAAGVSDQTATGTITAKVSPVGWAKSFSGTNVAAYRPTDPTALGMYLRVDDTGTIWARVRGFETMSDVNTGTGPFPLDTHYGGGGYWEKSTDASASAHNWMVFGDERTIYWWCVPVPSTYLTSQGAIRGFGDMVRRRTSDAYASFLQCSNGSAMNASNATGDICASCNDNRYGAVFITRSQTQLGGAIAGGQFSESRRAEASHTMSGRPATNAPPYPNPTDGGLDLERVFVTESNGPRGYYPGIYHVAQYENFAFATWDKVTGQGSLAGKKLLAVRCGATGNETQNTTAGYPGVLFVDIIGPWI